MEYDERRRDRARELRAEHNKFEMLLWDELRDRLATGYKFRRQHPLGEYYADLYCTELKLVVEADGVSHVERQDEDRKRDAWMSEQGITVLRFRNSEVLDDRESVIRRIREVCDTLKANPSPPAPLPGVPGRGEPNPGVVE